MAEDRARLMARLAGERGALLIGLLGLSQEALTKEPLLGDWTAKDLLAHVAAWDRWELRQMRRLLAGEAPEVVEFDAFNAAAVAASQDLALSEVVGELQDARGAWLAWLRGVPEAAFFQHRAFDDWDWAFPNCLAVQWQHDAEHAEEIAAWRQARVPEPDVGPKSVLVAALDGARRALLSASALVPSEERLVRPVCGAWNLRDLLGHVADWEAVGLEGLRRMASGQPPDIGQIDDIEAWNQEHAEARGEQPWAVVWTDLCEIREALMEALGGVSQEQLAQRHRFPWGPEGTVYAWLSVFVIHDHEHAESVRRATGED